MSLISEALGELHVLRFTAKSIVRWKDDPNFDVEKEAQRIVAIGLKLHVLLGGTPPGTFGEACEMEGFPSCEPHEWDNMTSQEQRVVLLSSWGLLKESEATV